MEVCESTSVLYNVPACQALSRQYDDCNARNDAAAADEAASDAADNDAAAAMDALNMAQEAADARDAAAQEAAGQQLINPLGTTDVRVVIGQVIKVLLGLAGVGAFAMFVLGGFQWMFSMGKPEQFTKGKQTMLYALLGLVVLFTSYTLVNFVVSTLTGATG